MTIRPFFLALPVALAACASEPPESFAVETPAAVERIGIRYADVYVREVSLPTYAAAETIFLQGAGGLLTEQQNAVWADDPTRAVTLGVSQSLQSMTRARVAPDPWPFGTDPEVAIDIRFETLAPGADGVYRAGQVFVAPDPDEADTARNRSLSFRLEVPFNRDGGQPAIAAARSALVSRLASDIARRGLR